MASGVKNSMTRSLNANALNLWYARLSVRLHSTDRLELYRKLMALIKNRFSLMDALERLYSIASKDGKSPDDSMAIATAIWMQRVRNGSTFSDKKIGGCSTSSYFPV